MANLTNKKFGVVHTSPSNLITNAASLEDGKLYFAAGDASGLVKQGIYGVVGVTTDGSIDIDGNGSGKQLAMFGTGGVADGTGYGLSQYNFTEAYKTKLDGIAANANNYSLPLATDSVRGGIKVGFTANDASIPVLLSDENAYVQLTKTSIEKGLGHTINVSVPSDAKFTDTDTWRAIKVNGEQEIANNASTALDISAGNNIEVSFTENKVVIAAKNVDASNADHATNATNASTADKVAQTFDISVNGSDKITYNGSVNKTLAIKGSNNIDVSSSVSNNVLTVTIDGSALATKADVSALISNLEGALTYEDAVSSASNLPTNLTATDKGKVYIASTNFNYPNDTNPTHKIEAQDMFIWNGTGWNIIDGQGAVENLSATLKYGEIATIATVDGVNISLTMPNEVHYSSKNIVGNASTDTANEAVTSNGVYLNHLENDTVTSYNKIVGGGIVKVTSASDGTITITGTEVGDVSAVVAGKGLTGGGDSGAVTLNVNGYQGIIVTDNSVGANLKSTQSVGTIGTNKVYGVGLDGSGYLAVNVPWTDNTDTKVTSVDNHYTPTANSSAELTATLSETAGSYAINTEYTVLTGVKAQRDAKGHITGITYTAQKVKDTNTDKYVQDTSSTGKSFILGHASQGSTAAATTNAKVYMSDGALYANSAAVELNATALVSGGVVYNAVQAAKSEAIEAATVYWETL